MNPPESETGCPGIRLLDPASALSSLLPRASALMEERKLEPEEIERLREILEEG